MRYGFIVLWMLFWSMTPAVAQVSIGIGLPGVSIGIHLPLFPELVQVPGYPVYYAPRLSSNYFFYDGLYWVYEEDNWYASSWYDGPWWLVAPEFVPLFVLRIPVRYYRRPPVYFRGWRSDAPPRWGEHWGDDWERRRSGWDRWNRSSTRAPAPLPVYQRQYSGDRYPRVERQQALHSQNYRYQPRDAVVRQHYQEHGLQRAPAPSLRGQQGAQSAKEFAPGQVKRQQGAQSAREFAPGQVQRQQGAQSAREFAPGRQMREQRTPGASSGPKDDGKGKGHGKGEGRGRERDK